MSDDTMSAESTVNEGQNGDRQAAEARNVKVAPAGDGRLRVTVCGGTACVFAGSLAVHDAFVEEVKAAGLDDKVAVSVIGCHGLCSQGPLAVCSGDTFYGKLKPQDVKKVVDEHLKGGAPVEKLMYKDPATGEVVRDWHEIAFYKAQTRIALRNVGQVDPCLLYTSPSPRD